MFHLFCCTFYGYGQISNDMYLPQYHTEQIHCPKRLNFTYSFLSPLKPSIFLLSPQCCFSRVIQLESQKHLFFFFLRFTGSQPYAFIHILCMYIRVEQLLQLLNRQNTVCFSYFCITKKELSSCYRDHLVYKAKKYLLSCPSQ